METPDELASIPTNTFNELCSQLISDNTGVYIAMNHDDPAIEYMNPDINNKKREKSKKIPNTIQLLK